MFIGDSIIEYWGRVGRAVWYKHYGSRKAYIYGNAGDRTEHLLHRIENNEFEGVNPKVAVLMIGIIEIQCKLRIKYYMNF